MATRTRKCPMATERNDKPITVPSEAMNCILKRGSIGGAVLVLQQLLNQTTSGDALAADGVFGLQTETAVRAWQRKLGLPEDGVVQGDLWKALGEERFSDPSSCDTQCEDHGAN